MTYFYETNPPWITGASLHTVTGMGSSLETVFGLGNPPTGITISQASLVAWYKSDTITGVVSGASFNTWVNSSLAGDVTIASDASATAFSAASQPVYLSNNLNGRPVVSFNGGQLLRFNSGAFSAPNTLFAVSSCSSLLANSAMAGAQPLIFNSGNKWCLFTGATLNTLRSITTNEAVFMAYVCSGSSSTGIAGTSANSNTTTGNAGTTVLFSDAIGGRADAAAYYFGNVAEFIWYARELPNSELQNVLKYLTTKYAL